MSIVLMKEDLADTEASLTEDKKFIAELGKGLCNKDSGVGGALKDSCQGDGCSG